MRIIMHNNQNGMIMVLAMFMMALLSMIGIASMMTSTTDIEIASGEQQYVETFYRSFAAHAIAGEVVRRFAYDRGLHGDEENPDGTTVTFETVNTKGDLVSLEEIKDDGFAFRVIDSRFLREDFDSVRRKVGDSSGFGVWLVDEQTVDELPCPQDMSASECKEIEANIGKGDNAFAAQWTDLRLIRFGLEGEQIPLADIDVDKIDARAQAGGGAEFGSDDLGFGSNATDLRYNIDARSRLLSGNFNKSVSRQALGFRLIL